MTLRELAELMPPRRRRDAIAGMLYDLCADITIADITIAFIVGLCAYLKP